jgi:hypothetical protein
MLIVEDKLNLDVDQLAGVQKVRENPLWWKPPAGESLRDRLEKRSDQERVKTRR